jgi:hypothetical protein
LEIEPYSRREVEYPEISAAHRASCLASGNEALTWRSRALEMPLSPTQVSEGNSLRLPPAAEVDLSPDELARVIRRRGSARQFAPDPVTFPQLAAILDLALAHIPADFAPMVDLYVIAHAVEAPTPSSATDDPL